MTWTYSDTATSDRDRVREAVGDTIATRPLVSDEIIARELSGSSVALAASRVARICRARERGLVGRSVEGVSVTRPGADSWDELIADLDRVSGYGAQLATMSAGGTSLAADEAVLSDPDYRPVGSGWLDERTGR